MRQNSKEKTRKLAAEQALIDRSYIPLDDWEIPWGWSNDPESLHVRSQFTGLKKDHSKVALKQDFGIPDARPILVDRSGVHLIDGGDGKYYLWGDESEMFREITETNLDNIIFTLKSSSADSLETKLLGYVKYDPWVDDKEFVKQELEAVGAPIPESVWELRQAR